MNLKNHLVTLLLAVAAFWVGHWAMGTRALASRICFPETDGLDPDGNHVFDFPVLFVEGEYFGDDDVYALGWPETLRGRFPLKHEPDLRLEPFEVVDDEGQVVMVLQWRP